MASTTTGTLFLDNFQLSQSSQTPTDTPTPTLTPTQTSTPTITPTNSGSLFSDGFESGDLSAWTNATTDGGDLAASSTSAHTGSYGMQAVIDDTQELSVYQDLSTEVSAVNVDVVIARLQQEGNSIEEIAKLTGYTPDQVLLEIEKHKELGQSL
jgi:hypothetical protein